MAKRMFQVLDEMNLHDTENKTRLVAVSGNFVSADKVKKGATVTMGIDEQALFDIASQKVIPIVVLVDSEEYHKRKTDG